MTGKVIVSMYSPEKKLVVYDYEVRWGDSWDPLGYGRAIDFSKHIFPHPQTLRHDVPQSSRIAGSSNRNSDYNDTPRSKLTRYLVQLVKEMDFPLFPKQASGN